ncbi:MFS general substrate transporter, partial [Saccharata proteae CBS 121410]
LQWEDDPDNPQNWSLARKLFHSFVVCSIAFVTTFASSVYTPGRDQVSEEFGVSSEVALLPFCMYTLGLAFGPLVASPCSENFGRRAVFFICTPIFGLFILGSGFSQSVASLIVCRFLAGVFGSPALTVGNAVLSDVWAPKQRAIPMAVIVSAPFLGPALGPLIGGFVVEGEDWRWTQWVILFFTVTFLTPAFFMSETYRKRILEARAKKQAKGSDLKRTPTSGSRSSRAAQSTRALLRNTLGRPLHMLFTEPIIFLFSIYVAFTFALQYSFFAAFPWVFENLYGFSLGSQGLTFLGLGVGVVIGFAFIVCNNLLLEKPRMERWAEQQLTTQPPPEYVLFVAYPGSIILPISLFLFAWSAYYRVHWIVPVIAEGMFGIANLLIFMACTLYLMNTYGAMYGASAMASCSLLRYILGATFPLFIVQMYERLNTGWATSLLGFISVVLAAIPWGFVRWGPQLRAKS